MYRGGYPEEDAPYNRNITGTYSIIDNVYIWELKAGNYLWERWVRKLAS